MDKKMTTLGCMLMLGALALPGVIAHNTGGELNHDVSTGLENDGPLGAPGQPTIEGGDPHTDVGGFNRLGAANDGVSGNYVGPAGPYLHVEDSTGGGNTVLFAAGAALCDAEVLGPGAASDVAVVDGGGLDGLNEGDVDGAEGGNLNQSGPAGTDNPDGTFDDGGHGAACHTPSTHYAHQPFNTPGCGNYAFARAEDVVLGGEVWISTACDFKNPVDGPNVFNEWSLCATNSVLTQNVTRLTECTVELAECVGGQPGSCPTGPGGEQCGGDSSADVGFFGEGSGHAGDDHMTNGTVPNAADDVPFALPTDGVLECSGDTTISESVFAWAAATMELTAGGVVVHNLSVPTTGWIDSTNDDL